VRLPAAADRERDDGEREQGRPKRHGPSIAVSH
jgi:hypothetical protein